MVTPRRRRAARVAWAILFAASVAAVPVLNRQTIGASAPAGERSARYGFQLTEASRASGVDFTHTGPTFDPRLGHIMPQVAAMGAAVAVADFDRDGWQDLYVTNSGEGSLNRLYRNTGDGRVRGRGRGDGRRRREPAWRRACRWAPCGATTTTTASTICSSTSTAARSCSATSGARSFERVTERAGLPRWVNANSATWLDYDRDGRLDLFIAGYWADGVNLWRLEHHPHHAGELRVRHQRRAQVPAAQHGRRDVRGRHRGAGHHQPALDAGRGGGGSARHRLPRPLLRQRLRRVGAVREPGRQAVRGRGADGGRGPHAEERHERLVRRHLQRRPDRDLQDQHLGAGRAGAGQRPLGADGADAEGRRWLTRTWRRGSASISAAGAGARSSAT